MPEEKVNAPLKPLPDEHAKMVARIQERCIRADSTEWLDIAFDEQIRMAIAVQCEPYLDVVCDDRVPGDEGATA